MTLHIDFETRSPVDLRKTGVYVYAECPDTDIWCAAYALGDEKPRLWLPGLDCPDDVREHIESGKTVTAHNASFERIIWRDIFKPRYEWPEPRLEQWRCTMAMSYALSMPGSLDMAAAALGLDHRKDDAGYRVMMQMAKPRKRHEDGTYTWWDDDERKQKLFAYCLQDVVVERAIEKRLLQLRPFEQRVWQLDQKINDLGVYVDVELCEAANDIVDQMKARLDAEMKVVTQREVSATTNANQLREWLNRRGLGCDSVAKDIVEGFLSYEGLAPDVRRALELRQAGSQTSVAKIDALLRRRQADGRARGMLQYHAAGTGRWGGRGFQPQNLKRPDEETNIAAAIELILTRNLDALLCFYDDPVGVVGDCIRGMVRAAP